MNNRDTPQVECLMCKKIFHSNRKNAMNCSQECTRAYRNSGAWAKNNREKYNEYQKVYKRVWDKSPEARKYQEEYRATPEHKEKQREYNKRYRDKVKDNGKV